MSQEEACMHLPPPSSQTYEHVMQVAFPAASRAAGRHIDQASGSLPLGSAASCPLGILFSRHKSCLEPPFHGALVEYPSLCR